MMTERHNITCRLIMKATEAGSLKECFDLMDIGSKDRLTLQNLQVPVGSTNRTILDWFSFTASLRRKDSLLAVRCYTSNRNAY